ncbi:uncharacterized protein [Panulirus ornatus]|uniref:uncharacterized protein isoform X2 n=1 Tax=Panulirus ornatus TaxID=150431 RepID=UPI003A8B748E
MWNNDPLKTSSPNNTCDSDDEDVLSIYASSWTELDTDIEQENYVDCKQKKSYKDNVISSTSVNENDHMKTIGMCLKMAKERSEYGQEINPNINYDSYVTYEASNGEFCERNSDIADGEPFHDVGFNKDLWHLFDAKKYSRKDRVSQSLYRETETSDKMDFGDSSRQKIHFSERSCDIKALSGKSVENCVKKPVLDRKGNDVKVDSDSNNIGLSIDSTFSRKVIKTEKYLSLLNSLQELNLTENVGYQEEVEEEISGREVKEKHVSVDEIYSKKGSKMIGITFMLRDSEPQISPYIHTLKEISKFVPMPKLPVNCEYRYCLTFIYQGVCLQPACPYHHEMCLELENYLGLLVLHYATHQQEHQAWKLIDGHTANSHYAPLLAVSLLVPLARFFLVLDEHHEFSVIEVPSYLTSPLVVAKVYALCEAHRGYDGYKLLQSFIDNVTSHYVEILTGIFVRYCEYCPETMAASPWEKVLLWKYEKSGSQCEERIKNILDIGWLKVLMEYKDISRVCDAYSHLCKTISLPSKIFTYFTCSVITFLNEIGERKTSFWVLKEVRRLKSDDAAIYISLVPTDKESAMSVLPELAELGQLACELRVPLPTCTWDLLSTLMMIFGNLTLGIDLLICAMQISSFQPDVNMLEKLMLECSRGDPTLLVPLSNLVCALSADSLTKLSPLLHYLVNFLAHGPLCAQQAKYNIIRHCQAQGINLSHGGIIANIPQIKGRFYDSVTESQVLCPFEVHVGETSVAEFSGLSENPVNQTAEISKKRNSDCLDVQDLKKRGLPVGCGYHCEGHKKRFVEKCRNSDKEIVMPTENYTIYPDMYRLKENGSTGSFGSPCWDMHHKDNIGSASLGCQDQFVSSSAFGYQDHLEPALESVCQSQILSLSDSQSGYQNLQRSRAYFEEQILLSGESEGFATEFGTLKRSNQFKSYLEDKRKHGQAVRKGECNEEREECTQPYHSQSSIYSQMDSQTNYFEPILELSQVYRGSLRQGSLFGEVPSSHLSVSSESLARASCFPDNSYEKGSDVSIALRHNSIQNLPHETRNNAKFFKHTQSQLCSSHKLAVSFDPQEKALHSSTNKIRLRDMNKLDYKGQKMSDSTKGLKMVKTNETREVLSKSPSFTDDYDEHLSTRDEKLSQLTETTNEHQSLRCFLPEITHCNGTLKNSNKNSTKATLSATSTLQGSSNSSSLEYIIIDKEGCSFSPNSLKTSNPEVALARSTVSQNKRRPWQQQQNSGSTRQRKRITRLEEIRRHNILGLSSHHKKSRLKFKDFTSMNMDSRNVLQEDNSGTTNKMPQLTGNVTDRTCISMPYQGQGESAATRLNVTGSHVSANITIQGDIALRKLNELLEYDNRTAYVNKMKGTLGSTTSYNSRERRLCLNVIRKMKRIRRKPWKGSKRPLHRNFHN